MTKFIALVSGKGGVGKTTTAVNLATALTGFGREVVLVDTNLGTPNIALHLGAPKLPVTLHDALRGHKPISETAYLHPSGLKVIPANIALEDFQEQHGERLKDTLMDLIGTCELVLLDGPAGIGTEVRRVLEIADEVLLITNPELPAVTDALRIKKIAEGRGCKVLGIILNRYSGTEDEVDPSGLEAMVELPLLAIVPEDPLVKRALLLRHPIVYTHPDSPASIGFKKLAARLVGQVYRETLA